MAWVEGRCQRRKGGYVAGAVWQDGILIADKMPSSLVDLARDIVTRCQRESGEECDCPVGIIAEGDLIKYKRRQERDII